MSKSNLISTKTMPRENVKFILFFEWIIWKFLQALFSFQIVIQNVEFLNKNQVFFFSFCIYIIASNYIFKFLCIGFLKICYVSFIMNIGHYMLIVRYVEYFCIYHKLIARWQSNDEIIFLNFNFINKLNTRFFIKYLIM